LCSVGNDFTEQGTLAANKLAEMINGEGKVAIMQGCPTAPNHVERYDAMKAALAKFPGITVIAGGIDNDSLETAQTQAAAVLAANPDLKGYLNVDATAKGIATALEEAGKVDQVKTVVMANLIEILNCIKEGTIDASYATQAQMQGSMVTLMLWQRSCDQEIPKKTDCGIVYIDSSNVDEWISIVTAE
jgi:ribose transport system substrate-binding protein